MILRLQTIAFYFSLYIGFIISSETLPPLRVKDLEELIKLYIPKWELTDVENTQIPEYQLTTLVSKTRNFLEKPITILVPTRAPG